MYYYAERREPPNEQPQMKTVHESMDYGYEGSIDKVIEKLQQFKELHPDASISFEDYNDGDPYGCNCRSERRLHLVYQRLEYDFETRLRIHDEKVAHEKYLKRLKSEHNK